MEDMMVWGTEMSETTLSIKQIQWKQYKWKWTEEGMSPTSRRKEDIE